MSFSTQSAFIHYGGWDEETREHPAMKWMEEYTNEAIDNKGYANGVPATKHHTEDFALTLSDGKTIKGADPTWKATAEVYAAFDTFKHIPQFIVVWEEEGGWGMTGMANLYFNLHAPLAQDVTDEYGSKWHGVAYGAFKFHYVKEGEVIKLKETKRFADPSPAFRLMLQNNMVNGEQLSGIVIGS